MQKLWGYEAQFWKGAFKIVKKNIILVGMQVVFGAYFFLGYWNSIAVIFNGHLHLGTTAIRGGETFRMQFGEVTAKGLEMACFGRWDDQQHTICFTLA